MKDVLKEVLKKIVDNGFEAYVVGGYPRDLLLGKDSEDYDICTSAKKEDLEKIFNAKFNDNFGSIILEYKDSKFEITTYRKEVSYEGVRMPHIVYTFKLEEDIMRRDFTINTICIDYQGNYLDMLNGISDINNKIIRCVGEVNKKMSEDPLRILRAIRFASTLQFSIDKELEEAIKLNGIRIKDLSFFRKKQELDMIFNAGGINLLKRYNLLRFLDIDVDNIIEVKSNIGIWAQIKYSDEYKFSKKEHKYISIIKAMLSKKEISNYDLYIYELEPLKIASEILGINNIEERYKKLVIKNRNDINISYDDIVQTTNILPSTIFRHLEEKIVDNKLSNNCLDIMEYIRNLTDYDIDK